MNLQLRNAQYRLSFISRWRKLKDVEHVSMLRQMPIDPWSPARLYQMIRQPPHEQGLNESHKKYKIESPLVARCRVSGVTLRDDPEFQRPSEERRQGHAGVTENSVITDPSKNERKEQRGVYSDVFVAAISQKIEARQTRLDIHNVQRDPMNQQLYEAPRESCARENPQVFGSETFLHTQRESGHYDVC